MISSFITSDDALAEFCTLLKGSDFIAIDTEFVRERTYYPQLALIQIGNSERLACIDPLAVTTLTPLLELFDDASIVKVFHAAGQDLEIFFYCFGRLPNNLYDTQVAATLLGHGDQIGYANLVQEMLGVELDKSHSRTDWLQRPLSDKQITYAEDDVRYLSQLYPKQRAQLIAQNRLDWLTEDFTSLADPARYNPDPRSQWKRIKGNNKLRPAQLAILQEVAAWREQQAMAEDRPRRRVISDELLIDMARLRPQTTAELAKLRGIPSGLVDRHSAALLQCIKTGLERDKSTWPQLPKRHHLSAEQEALIEALATILRISAAQHQLSATSLATRKELEALVSGERELAILSGWRRHHGGQQMLTFLNGETRLQVVNGQLQLIASV